MNTADEFVYSTNPKNFVTTILTIFDKALEEVAKISGLINKILTNIINNKKNRFRAKNSFRFIQISKK